VFNNYSIRWTADNPDASIPASRLITRVNNPPSADTWYRITLTDRFDLKRSDSVIYKSIQPDASLTIDYVSLGDSTEYPEKYGSFYDNDVLSAPGKYSFDFSASKNAVAFEIAFGDGETLETGKDTTKIVHEYQLPGKYKAVLFAKGEKPFECIDSVSREAELVFAVFRMPNAFSPNDDGNNDLLNITDNDVFRSEDISVVSIDITIFDRAGRKVHEYMGNIREWSGWKGNVMQSDRQAPEGVYFYVISLLYAYEDENKPIGSQVQKGFVHLFRE
jgi:gliding motility-associated-like protein